MKLIPRQISAETFRYQSPQAVNELKADMQQLFEKTKGWNFSPNLNIEFVNDDYHFRVRPERSPYFYDRGLDIDKYESAMVIIVGQLFPNNSGMTTVDFVVRPNLLVPFFFFFDIVLGTCFLIANSVSYSVEAQTIGLGATFLGPISILIATAYSKRKFKNRFVKAFKLEAVH